MIVFINNFSYNFNFWYNFSWYSFPLKKYEDEIELLNIQNKYESFFAKDIALQL